jgi:hypothetical protein
MFSRVSGDRRGHRKRLLGQEPVLHREEPGLGSCPRVDLRVDVLDMVADGLRGDHEPLRDLLVRQSARKESEHLDLACGEPEWPVPAACDPMAGGAEHGLDRLGVEPTSARVGPQLGGRPVRRERGPVGRGSRIAWYASAAPRILAGREIALPDSPCG